MAKQTTRALTVNLLENIINKQQYANLELNQVLNREHLSLVDQKLVTRLLYGTIQWQLRLDYNWQQFAKHPEQLPLWVQVDLRVALYQFLFLDKIPAHAIFNEATAIAKKRDGGRYANLVNAILRQVQRHGEADYTTISDPIQRLSITGSVPLWLTQRLVEQYGLARCEQLFAVINQPPFASIRVNTVKTDRATLLAELLPDHPTLTESPLSQAGLRAEGGNFAQDPAFAAGEFTVQDESSMLVAPSLQVKSNQVVLDACAAPGGKTTHIAEYLDPHSGGHVVALDIHQHKLDLIRRNAERLGVSNRIQTKLLDARQVDTAYPDASFDRILVDAPCSGLGLLRRKPEIRYAKTAEQIAGLPKVQAAILAAVAPKLKVGGLLVYSTCTIIAAENQDVVAQFLENQPNFEAVPVAAAQALNWTGDQKNFQLLMDDENSDGFFIACLKRIQ
ncbi:16S rRNA (cytosine(967)-C(5))-methyltransferase RsmB [Lapidilactobacillus gannanensis]|uniref:16S rRNA (cytosine(967)-C(5))-methyltransferase n=1 Tax=Lapidilactobacillus gannanensis TaxID=2486002 RepID=A0ABW4BQ88_9LACO|nr:16S rRNA (cytosine(967)-C(5))-methyltransferase RsmB [Lapidilactobacillus gannanensis]